MLANALRAEHVHVFMTGLARDRIGLLELMRAMAADALGVSFRKYRGRRDDRLFGRVTGCAFGACSGGWRVLMLMANAARRARRFAMGGVRSGDFAVTDRTRRGLRFGVFVRLMAAETLVC